MSATERCNMLICNVLSCSIVFENPATTLLQLCYNPAMSIFNNSFWICSYGILSIPVRCFEYARKVFWVCSQGVLGRPVRLRDGLSHPAQRRVVPGVQACKPLRDPFGRAKRYYLAHLERKETLSSGLSAVIFNTKMT